MFSRGEAWCGVVLTGACQVSNGFGCFMVSASRSFLWSRHGKPERSQISQRATWQQGDAWATKRWVQKTNRRPQWMVVGLIVFFVEMFFAWLWMFWLLRGFWWCLVGLGVVFELPALQSWYPICLWAEDGCHPSWTKGCYVFVWEKNQVVSYLLAFDSKGSSFFFHGVDSETSRKSTIELPQISICKG